MVMTNKNSGILNGDISVVKAVTGDMKEGVDYININNTSETKLGKMLSPGYSRRFMTFLGPVHTMKSFMYAIKVPNYPMKFLRKSTFNHKDQELLKGKFNDLPNYWALVAYALCQKVKSDKELKQLLFDNKLMFTSYDVTKATKFFNKTIVASVPKHTMGKYIAIVRLIEDLIKKNEFTDDKIEELVEKCKEHPDKDILDNIACTVIVKEN